MQVIGHRGARILGDVARIAPENTMSAFQEAARLGAAVELDVQATRDGVLVVHHDERTGNPFCLPGGEKRIRSLRYDDLQTAQLAVARHEATVRRLFGPGHSYSMSPAYLEERIPTLAEVVESLPQTPIYLELKTRTANARQNNLLEQRVVDFIRSKNLYDRVAVISFCRKSLRKVKALDPRIRTGWNFARPHMLRNRWNSLLIAYAKKFLKVEILLPTYKEATSDLIQKAHRMGLRVVPWVWRENREEEARLFPMMLSRGVDGLITNAVDTLQKFLKTAQAS